MDGRAACLAQATACRVKAEADPANRDYWVDESIKWLERAVHTTFEVDEGSPQLDSSSRR
jgi:hypothetical protein